MTPAATPGGGAAGGGRARPGLVEAGTTVGLGSGRAASAFIEALGARVRAGPDG